MASDWESGNASANDCRALLLESFKVEEEEKVAADGEEEEAAIGGVEMRFVGASWSKGGMDQTDRRCQRRKTLTSPLPSVSFFLFFVFVFVFFFFRKKAIVSFCASVVGCSGSC